ncbi:MAG: hypothetical protein EOM66_07555 [Clostridia bacterium]|nr:hypothetical protein [Clostridia bacterium]
MKKLLALAVCVAMLVAMAGCNNVQPAAADGGEAFLPTADTVTVDYQYKTADEVKAMIEAGDAMVILDIVPEESYKTGHLPGSIPTYAYPADTAELQTKLAPQLDTLKATEDPILVVCPGGGGGAKNTIAYYVHNGVPAEKLFILENGAKNWPYPEMLVTDDAAAASAPAAAETLGFAGEYVVNPQYVAEHMHDANVLLVDARGEEAAATGTVEGAVAVTWQMFASVADGASGDAMWGTILDTERLNAVLSSTGIAPEKEIIIFAGAQTGWGDEGRVAWELIAAGYPNVKMVDGGYEGLAAAGIPTAKGAAAFTPAQVSVQTIDETHVINTDALVAAYDSFKIVDVRAAEEYDGATLYGEAKGGHLPGSMNIQYTDMFNADGFLKSNAELTAMFEAAGLAKTDKIVTYCTAGIRSAYMQLVLEMCGFEDSLNYDESFYRWAASQEVE